MHWSQDAVFYHLYPMGCLGAPGSNDFRSPSVPRLADLHDWLDYWQGLGINALYLGPLFESTSHGYDTVDYYCVDRRLGTNESLAALSRALHERGIRLVLDAVFNHVGRDFWAFKDVQAHGHASAYQDWFHLDFSRRSPYGDPFAYEGWNGHYNLVKLNVRHPAVREHLFGAVRTWVEQFDIDGLRLDAADCLDLDFLRDLSAFGKRLKPDFWLMGEVIHGDYRRWMHEGSLDSVTNYELYKGLYSSHNDRNYFELAYSLNRQFGDQGMYRDRTLYSFADNHDVDRVASQVREGSHLYPLHVLLMTMPGVPSVYYGSEWGLEGRKQGGSDHPLRPALTPESMPQRGRHPDLVRAIASLVRLRQTHPALRRGTYKQLSVDKEQFVFLRELPDERMAVAVNSAPSVAQVSFALPGGGTYLMEDVLSGETFRAEAGRVQLRLDPSWARVLRVRSI